MSAAFAERRRAGWVRAIWAGLLSLVLPGLGQVYAGAWRLGILLVAACYAAVLSLIAVSAICEPTPVLTFVFVAVLLLTNILRVAVAGEAVVRARRSGIVLRRRWFRSVWLTAAACLVIGQGGLEFGYRWRSFAIPSESNVPTLEAGDYVLVAKARSGQGLSRGDMVYFAYPRDPSLSYVKRAIGLAGDRVRMSGGVLTINGQPVARERAGSYADPSAGADTPMDLYRETLPDGRSWTVAKLPGGSQMDDTPEYTVPDGFFFCLGDSRDNSVDSRMMDSVGFVPVRNVLARSGTIFWSHDLARIGMQVK